MRNRRNTCLDNWLQLNYEIEVDWRRIPSAGGGAKCETKIIDQLWIGIADTRVRRKMGHVYTAG